MKSRHVALMYISRVSGHRQATMALSKAIKARIPDAEIMSINGFGYNYPVLERVVNAAYMGIIRHTPRVWDYLYDNPKVVKRSANLRRFLNKSSHRKLEKLFRDFPADTVVCSQAFPCGMVADYKMATRSDLTLIGVLTDWAPHSYWINEGVDHYVVPSECTKERFVHKGVPADKIHVLGIPIRPKFSESVGKAEARRQLALAPETPTLLVMGGGQGLGRMKEAVRLLGAASADLQLLVVAGANQSLYRWLERHAPRLKKKTVFFDYANNVDVLMEAADLIVTKPGGMTTSECLAKGLPMVILDPLPGQEARNTDFLLEKGIAIHAHEIMALAGEVDLLLRTPGRLAAMSAAARSYGKPHAADDIARLVEKARGI